MCFLNHREYQALWQLKENGVIDRKLFRSTGNCERLEFNTRQIVSRENPFSQYSIVCYVMRGVRKHAIHDQIHLKKLKFSGGIRFRIHQVENRLGFCNLYL